MESSFERYLVHRPAAVGLAVDCQAPVACEKDDHAPRVLEGAQDLVMSHVGNEDLSTFLDRTMSTEVSLVCDDDALFQTHISAGDFVVRKTTNRKGKKLDLLNQNLDADDLLAHHRLSGKARPTVERRPPVGKTWVKQLFASQMGLTILAALYGMTIGVPLDCSFTDWDVRLDSALARVHRDMASEDPYLTVITHPCGSWDSWSQFRGAKGGGSRETVLSLRDEPRSVLRLVNKVVVDRIKANRHVFVEQPYGSNSLDEPEMSGIRGLIEDGSLLVLEVDGCQVGYHDQESGLPYHRPSYYLTSMLTAESMFADCRCCCAQHEPLEGSNKFGARTAQVAEWPEQLDRMVLECFIQQAAVEQAVLSEAVLSEALEVADAYPTRQLPIDPTSQRAAKRSRRKGRVATLMPEFNAPPVYLRPDAELGHLPLVDEADQDFRARQAQALDPILSQAESDRRREWLAIDPELRKIIRDLHVNFGHPTSVTLQRILRRQGAKPEAIRAAGLLACDSCGETIHRKRPRPVRLPNQYQFLDTFYARDVRGVTFAFVNIVDDATGFQVVACLGELQGPPASRAVLRHFTSSWSSWAGLPHSLQVDRGKEYMAAFADGLKQFGVEQEVMPLEAPWKGGK